MLDALKTAKTPFLIVDESCSEAPSVLISQAINVIVVVTEGLFKSEVLTCLAKQAIQANIFVSVAVDNEVEMPDWFKQGGGYTLIRTTPTREDIRACFEKIKEIERLTSHLIIPERHNSLIN